MVVTIITVLGWQFYFRFINVVWRTAFNMPKIERYSKEKKEKIAAAAKGCRSITDVFERLEYYDYTQRSAF